MEFHRHKDQRLFDRGEPWWVWRWFGLREPGWEGRHGVRRRAWLWQGRQTEGGREVVLTTAPSTGRSAPVSGPVSSPTAGATPAGGSSAFGSAGVACSDSAFDCFLRVKGKRVNMWEGNITEHWTINLFILLHATNFIKSVLERKSTSGLMDLYRTEKSRNRL